jgi:2'-5' RNA ligase
MRTFFALDLNPRVVSSIETAVDSLGSLQGRISWVPASNLHVTMNFVGEVDENRIPDLCELAAETAGSAGFDHIDFEVGGLVCVPPSGYLRMIWAEVADDSGRMLALYETLKQALRGFGAKVENRPFRGHVTVARIKSTRRPEAIRKAVGKLSGEALGSVRTGELVLYSSKLARSGAIYTPLVRAALGQRSR